VPELYVTGRDGRTALEFEHRPDGSPEPHCSLRLPLLLPCPCTCSLLPIPARFPSGVALTSPPAQELPPPAGWFEAAPPAGPPPRPPPPSAASYIDVCKNVEVCEACCWIDIGKRPVCPNGFEGQASKSANSDTRPGPTTRHGLLRANPAGRAAGGFGPALRLARAAGVPPPARGQPPARAGVRLLWVCMCICLSVCLVYVRLCVSASCHHPLTA
jgi:hypothetical protein